MISDEISPPQSSIIKSAALLSAYTVMLGSQPLSYLKEASVLRLCLFADFLIEMGLKYADSRKTLVVCSVTPDFKPPKTPAIHMGSFELQIIKSSEDKALSFSSRVIKVEPSFAFLTIILFPSIFAASKA